jgi:hypothetical protein
MLGPVEEEIVSWYSTQFIPCAPRCFLGEGEGRGDQDLETDLYGSRGTGFSHTLHVFTKIKSNKSSNTTHIYRDTERLHVV